MSQQSLDHVAASAAAASREANRGAPRLLFIDNIRWTMILLVLSMHAVDTYSPFGNWYFTDRQPLSLGERIFFVTYQSFLQGFFMALLFFIAAYFTPASYDRKGPLGFVRDRCMRLGLPTLLYIFAIGPATEFYIARSWTGGGGFAHQWFEHIADGEWLSGTGPMWFCAALLAFSIVYALFHIAVDRFGESGRRPAQPSLSKLALFVTAMAGATFLVRTQIPGDRSVLNMHPGDFPQYMLMFAAGLLAARGRWLEEISDRRAAAVALVSLIASLLLWIGLLTWAAATPGDHHEFSGDWNLPSAGKSLWEALVCVGMSFALTALYRRRFRAQGRLARLLSDNAFAVYLVHPPVLIAIALLLRGVIAPAPVKAAILTLLAAIVCFTLSTLVLRRLPLLRRIL